MQDEAVAIAEPDAPALLGQHSGEIAGRSRHALQAALDRAVGGIDAIQRAVAGRGPGRVVLIERERAHARKAQARRIARNVAKACEIVPVRRQVREARAFERKPLTAFVVTHEVLDAHLGQRARHRFLAGVAMHRRTVVLHEAAQRADPELVGAAARHADDRKRRLRLGDLAEVMQIRADAEESLARADQHAAVFLRHERPYVRRSLPSFQRQIDVHDAAVAFAHVEALVGADPEPSAAVGSQAHDRARAQAGRILRIVIDVHEAAVGLQLIEPAEIGADPDRAVAVLGERPDVVVAERLEIARHVTPAMEAFAAGVELVEARAFAAAPDAPGAVDQKRVDDVAADRGGLGRIVAEHAERDAVVAREPVVRAQPDEAVAILRELVHGARRQPVGNRHRHELRRRGRRRGSSYQRDEQQRQQGKAIHVSSRRGYCHQRAVSKNVSEDVSRGRSR